MKFTRLKAAGIAAGVAALAFIPTPTNAAGVSDGTGVDWDAACRLGNPAAATPTANYIPSPGVPGCDGVSTYDGSTESTDLGNVDLSSVGGQLVATFTVDGNIPAAGSTTPPTLGAADLPDNTFVGLGYKALFQNPDLQDNTPYTAATRLTGTPIFGLNEHWQDGFHFFVGFDAVWDGGRWIHSAQVGVMDPSPDGGFFFDELGVNQGTGWNDDDPSCFARSAGNWDASVVGSTVTVKVKGVVKASNVQAVGGCVESWYAKAGNGITNVKFLSTADATVTLPVTVPLSLVPGFGDLTSVGGYIFFSDTTAGNSRNVGILGALQPNRVGVSYTSGLLGFGDKLGITVSAIPDTLGDGPRCWTSTVGGLLPSNPLWVPNQPCYIDDDSLPGPNGNIDPGVGKGTILSEWWETPLGFTF